MVSKNKFNQDAVAIAQTMKQNHGSFLIKSEARASAFILFY